MNLHRFGLKAVLLALSAALAIINAAYADTLTVTGRLALPYCTNVRVQGHVCYVTDSYGLEAVDVTDPRNPVLIGRLALPDTAQHVILRDTIAFVSDADSGLAIVNGARPESLELLSRWEALPGYARETCLFQDTAFLADGYCTEGRFPPYRGGLMVLNVQDIRAPIFVRHYAQAQQDTVYPYNFRWVNYASVAYDSGRLYLPGPVVIGDYEFAFSSGNVDPWTCTYDFMGIGPMSSVHKMGFRNPYAFITYPKYYRFNFTIVRFYQGSPDSIYEFDLGGNGRGIWAESARVFVTLDSTVKLLDVSDISNPTVLAACSLDNIANGLQFKDPYVYVANGPNLTILNHTPTGVGGQAGSRQRAVGSLKATPNPFVTYATVPGHEKESFELYDVAGRHIKTCRGDRIGEGLPAGVYFLKAQASSSPPLRIVKVR